MHYQFLALCHCRNCPKPSPKIEDVIKERKKNPCTPDANGQRCP
jgi:hypothetical protein